MQRRGAFFIRLNRNGRVIEQGFMHNTNADLDMPVFQNNDMSIWIDTTDERVAIERANNVRLRLIQEGRWPDS